ncbi:MAG TPA: isoprenylcysteine carboxylmethyltransferase family protein [Candidatus Dormibacteraeota bacterium]|nr:isoprenylcysteine carboxylmethyltransferase family protein [Candidatus Dormibacteraeota bacterium]
MAEKMDAHRHPDVIAPPPLLFLGPLLAGLLLGRLVRPPRMPGPVRLLGLPLLAAGAALGGWFFATMRRAGTPVDPYETPVALVTEGPFEYSRNPAYLCMTLIYTGVSLLAGAGWSLLMLPGVLAVVDRGVVRREEAYLEDHFGAAYREYRARVGRWL